MLQHVRSSLPGSNLKQLNVRDQILRHASYVWRLTSWGVRWLGPLSVQIHGANSKKHKLLVISNPYGERNQRYTSKQQWLAIEQERRRSRDQARDFWRQHLTHQMQLWKHRRDSPNIIPTDRREIHCWRTARRDQHILCVSLYRCADPRSRPRNA